MKRSMICVALTLFFAFSSSVYALNQNFEGGGNGYSLSYEGKFDVESNSGNAYMSFGQEDGQFSFFSSLIFEGVDFAAEGTTLSFDYNFSYSLDMDKFNAFADSLYSTEGIYIDLLSLEFGGADYFSVGTYDYTFYEQRITPDFTSNPVVNTLLESYPATDFYGINFNPVVTDIQGGELDGFLHVELDLTEFVNYLSLQGGQATIQDLLFEVGSMGITYPFNSNNYNIDDDIFTYTASVDNITLGTPTAAVPEPTACALFVVGMLYLGRRIKRK